MLQAIAAAAAATLGAAPTVVSAPTASADEYDYLDFLDSKGVLYTSSLDAIEDGKWVCHNLRNGIGVPITEQFTASSGYSVIEARTIVGRLPRTCVPTSIRCWSTTSNRTLRPAESRHPGGGFSSRHSPTPKGHSTDQSASINRKNPSQKGLSMARMTPGKRLVRLLHKSLAEGCSWTESELVSLAKIEKAEDRLAVLEAIFAAETAKAEPSTRRVAEVSGEIRQTEQLIVRQLGGVFGA